MTNNVFRKSLVIGIIVLFVGAGVVQSISGNIAEENIVMEKNLGEYRGILFEDDFNDNEKDFGKWSEFVGQGQWWEINQRTEFRLSGAGDPISEGIESIYVSVTITQDLSLIISADMISNINSNIDAGELHFKVNDGENWIWAIYSRDDDRLMFKDSNDPDWITIGYRGDGTWDNEIKIYSDRYRVQLDGFNSGWVDDSLFSTSSQMNMVLYSKLEASSDYFLKVGYDNAKIEVENQPPEKPNKPSGPTSGKVGISHTYQTSTTDPDGDQIWYMFDWGDDTPLEWDGPNASGTTFSKSNIWNTEGTYHIKVKAKDVYDAESDWSDPLKITISKSRAFNYDFNLPSWLFERFQNLLPILKQIFQRLELQ